MEKLKKMYEPVEKNIRKIAGEVLAASADELATKQEALVSAIRELELKVCQINSELIDTLARRLMAIKKPCPVIETDSRHEGQDVGGAKSANASDR